MADFKGFWDRVDKSGECWEWKGALNDKGYGRVAFLQKSMFAHRAAWIITNGQIPDGLFVCHRCDNPACVRPDHLFLGTHQDNMDDMVRKGRQRCRPSYGEKSGRSKLTEDQVREIRARFSAGESAASIGREFGIRYTHVNKIHRRLYWKHVE